MKQWKAKMIKNFKSSRKSLIKLKIIKKCMKFIGTKWFTNLQDSNGMSTLFLKANFWIKILMYMLFDSRELISFLYSISWISLLTALISIWQSYIIIQKIHSIYWYLYKKFKHFPPRNFKPYLIKKYQTKKM